MHVHVDYMWTTCRLTWLTHVHGLYLSLQHARERLLAGRKLMQFILSGSKAGEEIRKERGGVSKALLHYTTVVSTYYRPSLKDLRQIVSGVISEASNT